MLPVGCNTKQAQKKESMPMAKGQQALKKIIGMQQVDKIDH